MNQPMFHSASDEGQDKCEGLKGLFEEKDSVGDGKEAGTTESYREGDKIKR